MERLPAHTFILLVVILWVGCDGRDSGNADRGSSPDARISAPTSSSTSDSNAATHTTKAASRPSDSAATRPHSTATSPDQSQPPEKLYGTWIAKDVDTKLGDVMVKLTFRDEGGMKLAAWSDIPFVGQVRDKQGPYSVDGNTISSDAIRGGTTVQYRFDGDVLVIEYKDGKTVRFTREP